MRAGKLIELDLADGTSDADVEEMCRKLLANTVIENFRIERAEQRRVKSAVIVFPGSNCDRDMAVALEAGDGRASRRWSGTATPSCPTALDLIALPGGFSYGDYLRSGAMAARSPVMRAVVEAAERGVPVLGICNGFQVLTEAGLLPGALMRNAGTQLRLPRRRADGREQPVRLHRRYDAGRDDHPPGRAS